MTSLAWTEKDGVLSLEVGDITFRITPIGPLWYADFATPYAGKIMVALSSHATKALAQEHCQAFFYALVALQNSAREEVLRESHPLFGGPETGGGGVPSYPKDVKYPKVEGGQGCRCPKCGSFLMRRLADKRKLNPCCKDYMYGKGNWDRPRPLPENESAGKLPCGCRLIAHEDGSPDIVYCRKHQDEAWAALERRQQIIAPTGPIHIDFIPTPEITNP